MMDRCTSCAPISWSLRALAGRALLAGLLLAGLLLAGCFGDKLFSGNAGDAVTVCVSGDNGHCCELLSTTPVCTEKGCTSFQRTASRCIYCQARDIDDGGKAARPGLSPPPGGPDDDAGEQQLMFVKVCGAATYR